MRFSLSSESFGFKTTGGRPVPAMLGRRRDPAAACGGDGEGESSESSWEAVPAVWGPDDNAAYWERDTMWGPDEDGNLWVPLWRVVDGWVILIHWEPVIDPALSMEEIYGTGRLEVCEDDELSLMMREDSLSGTRKNDHNDHSRKKKKCMP